jgi:hypothetical protein
LCGKDSQLKAGDDPWIAQDPWKQYTQGKSASCIPSASDGIQQLADRIQNEVLQKLPAMTQMEQDDMPERLSTLENQVQQLMGQHKALDQTGFVKSECSAVRNDAMPIDPAEPTVARSNRWALSEYAGTDGTPNGTDPRPSVEAPP